MEERQNEEWLLPAANFIATLFAEMKGGRSREVYRFDYAL